MPTELGHPFEVTWHGDPPQMLTQDIPLWHQFLDVFGASFQRFYYNVKLGGPDITKIKADPIFAKQWYDVTAKRPDVLGEKQDELWIIEVSSSPFLRAVGQCLTYKLLWDQDPKINKPARMVLLCHRLDADLTYVLQSYRVQVLILPDPTQQTDRDQRSPTRTIRKKQGVTK